LDSQSIEGAVGEIRVTEDGERLKAGVGGIDGLYLRLNGHGSDIAAQDPPRQRAQILFCSHEYSRRVCRLSHVGEAQVNIAEHLDASGGPSFGQYDTGVGDRKMVVNVYTRSHDDLVSAPRVRKRDHLTAH
jgi:hypothetical protein